MDLYIGQDIQFRGFRLHMDQWSALLPQSKAQEILSLACSFVIDSSAPISFQAEFTFFTDASTQGWGAQMGIPRFWVLNPFRLQALHQYLIGAQGGNFGPVMDIVILALHHWVSILWGHQPIDNTAHNTTVVAYINQQGGTHSHTLLCLVVDLFLWLQTQDIDTRARLWHPGCLNMIVDHFHLSTIYPCSAKSFSNSGPPRRAK